MGFCCFEKPEPLPAVCREWPRATEVVVSKSEHADLP